jgi:abortive infection bacteriophage resistance protein
MISKFYKNMLNKDKKIIAKSFNVSYNYLESWIETFAYIRNICAHYGRLYNVEFTKKPKLYSTIQDLGIKNNRIFGALICLKIILKLDPSWNEFINNISTLFDQYLHINISYMGFVDGWKELLSVQNQLSLMPSIKLSLVLLV